MTLNKSESGKDSKRANAKEETDNKDKEKQDDKKEEEPMQVDQDKDKDQDEELSEEDKKLKEQLELCVTRLGEDDQALYPDALANLGKLIRASTTSMTSVPKPLKFMIPHYDSVKAAYEKIKDAKVKRECADVVSVLAMTMSDQNETLKYKLKGNTDTENVEAWGHEYIRHLSGEIVTIWNELDESLEDEAAVTAKRDELMTLVKAIVPSQMKHHAEAEACDLLMEVEKLEMLDG